MLTAEQYAELAQIVAKDCMVAELCEELRVASKRWRVEMVVENC
jgi:hypothetical protein